MGKHTLPPLPYSYDALEPAICTEIMELHHSKHHATYVNNLNAAEDQYESAVSSNDLKKQIELQGAIKFNGGGHINHSLFWENLAPLKKGGGDLGKGGSLTEAIKKRWGSPDELQKELSAAALSIQGSGWAWLGYDTKLKELVISTTPNQDPLTTAVPLIGIDMWEHAFYIQYQVRKADYLKNIWTILNFETANKRYEAVAKL